jgi:hypothetical protein
VTPIEKRCPRRQKDRKMEEATDLHKKLTADDLRRMAGRTKEAERERKLLFLAEKLEDAARQAKPADTTKH